MNWGIASLVLAYVLSQFYRAFLAVLSPVLKTDLGIGPEALSEALGLWFLVFAAMQIPVGASLDRFGPRWTSSILLAFGGGGGALLFATAQGVLQIKLAMVLIGIGCSPVLMASYYIFARLYSPKVFATLGGMVVGIGSLGNIASSLPMALAAEALGWRGAMLALAAVTLLVAGAIALLLRDPPQVAMTGKGSVLDLLRMPALWLILPMMAVNYLPAAGLRGLWTGPYLSDVFGADAAGIGRVTLLMGLAMVLGNFAYGPLDRIFGTRKWVIFGGNALGFICLIGLWHWPLAGGWVTMALLAGVGFFGSSFAVLIAHGRAMFPAHLMGRGVTLMNLFGIGSIGLAQFATSHIHASAPTAPPEAAFSGVFGFYVIMMGLGLLIYLFARDRTD